MDHKVEVDLSCVQRCCIHKSTYWNRQPFRLQSFVWCMQPTRKQISQQDFMQTKRSVCTTDHSEHSIHHQAIWRLREPLVYTEWWNDWLFMRHKPFPPPPTQLPSFLQELRDWRVIYPGNRDPAGGIESGHKTGGDGGTNSFIAVLENAAARFEFGQI